MPINSLPASVLEIVPYSTDPIVTVANLNEMALPLIIGYETESHKKGTLKFPAEIWSNTAVFKLRIPVKEKLLNVTIDPEHVLPDVNISNNRWNAN